jgi:hypothetical protein
MNTEKIKISKKLKKAGIEIAPEEIITDLKAKSIYTTINGRRVGCYFDSELKTVIMFGDITISQYFINSLVKLLKLKN